MRNNDPKLGVWIFVLALCCGLPLLLLAGGGSLLALGTSFLTNNLFLLVLGLILAAIFVWLFLRRRSRG